MSFEAHKISSPDLLLYQRITIAIFVAYHISLLSTVSTMPGNCHDISTIQNSVFVRTAFEKRLNKMDLSDLNSSTELAALKAIDPFLYYSIPPLRHAALHSKEVNASVLRRDKIDRSSVRKVTRQTKVSAECHVDLLMEHFLDEWCLLDDDEVMDNDDDLYDYLRSCETSKR